MSACSLPTPAQQTRAQRIEAILKELRPKVDAVVRQLVERAVDVPEAEEFGAIDLEFRNAGQQLANEVRQASVASRKNTATGVPESRGRAAGKPPSTRTTGRTRPCVCWGRSSVRGPTTYGHRGGPGLFPEDQARGRTPQRRTPAAEQGVTLAGTGSNRFAEAADKVWPELAGLCLSARTAQRTTAAGDRLGELQERGALRGFPTPWSWHQDTQAKRCASSSRAAPGVRPHGPGGTQAASRMPYGALVSNPVPQLPAAAAYAPPAGAAMPARYVAGRYDLDDVGLQLRRPAWQGGREHAALGMGRTEGGNGLEDFGARHVPRAGVDRGLWAPGGGPGRTGPAAASARRNASDRAGAAVVPGAAAGRRRRERADLGSVGFGAACAGGAGEVHGGAGLSSEQRAA